jgi:hypothetical protein
MRLSDRATIITIAVVAAAVLIEAQWPAKAGLPPKIQEAVVRHEVLTVIDTATVNHLQRERDASQRREVAATAGRRRSDSTAAAQRVRADSLEAVARASTSATDSAAAWQQAYETKKGETSALEVSRDSARAEAREATVQLAAADSIAATWKTHALRGDSLIVRLVPLAERAGTQCRIARVLHCPSRKQTAIVAVMATIAVRSGWVKLP